MTLDDSLGGGVVRNQITSGPWFYPTGGFDKVLAKDAEGNPMLISWQRDGVTHYFSVVMNPTVDLLRRFADLAGVHLYTPNGKDAVQIGNDVVFLMAKTNGQKRLILPEGCRARAIAGPIEGDFGEQPVWEAVSGRAYGFLVSRE